jgi:hypothetical protein
VAEGDLVTTDEAAWVFRRAAELEAVSLGGPEALLDERTLEAAGAEAGLAPSSIRAALAELRAGAMAVPEPAPDEPAGRRSLVLTRAVPGPPAAVQQALDDLARRNVLAVRRRRWPTTVWERRTGLSAACMRAVPGRRARPLATVGRLTATLGPVAGAPDVVRVELRAELLPARRLLPLRTRAGVGTGVAVGLGVAALAQAQTGPGVDDALFTLAGAGGAAWAGLVGVRAARDARDALGDALAYALDQLEHRRSPALVPV